MFQIQFHYSGSKLLPWKQFIELLLEYIIQNILKNIFNQKKIIESCLKFYSSRFTFLVPIVYIVYFHNWLLFLHIDDKIILIKFEKTLIYN